MRTRQTSLSQDRRRFRRQEEMGAQDPKATGSTAPVFGSECPFPTPFTNSTTRESANLTESTWHGPLVVARDGQPQVHLQIHDDSQASSPVQATSDYSAHYPPSPPPARDHYEELAQLLMKMVPSSDGEELAEAFREGSTIPPITRQSLSELDISNIVNNVKLRHDVNFDRDLSFRPNLDGLRGQAKTKATARYWKALAAELVLYAGLFRETLTLDKAEQESLVYHAQYRIPVMFETIQEVLKSLVPERDQSRVSEHLDRSMLMQEIERGVCDFARLAEWMAQLLKEHCAPMRDVWVDEMVSCVRKGAYTGNAEMIVDGLRRLFGILETMKLDVANHQIRNLKAILIDDTIKFERQYHLERLVKGRSRVDIYESQLWYQRVMSTMEQCHSGRHPTPTKHFEIFSCAIIEYLFDNDICSGLPSTLYLDEDRLHTIKAEIDDLICLDVCSDVFDFFLKSFQYEGDVLATIRRNLCNSLVAIMGNAMGYGIQQWIANSEALSLELLRQALKASGQTAVPNHEISAAANDHLLHALQNVKTSQRSSLKPTLVQKVGICIQRHINSTPLDLYNDLVANSSGATTSSTSSLHLFSKDASPSHGESSESIKWQDLANRISHIILLNWRVWKDIAYVPQELSSFETSHTSIAQPGLSSRPESPASRQEPSAVPTMHTGEPPESGTDSHAAREMRF